MKPISRRELIRRLMVFGYEGPFAGKRHEFMRRPSDRRRVTIPNPHSRDITVRLLKLILRQAGMSEQEWESTK